MTPPHPAHAILDAARASRARADSRLQNALADHENTWHRGGFAATHDSRRNVRVACKHLREATQIWRAASDDVWHAMQGAEA